MTIKVALALAGLISFLVTTSPANAQERLRLAWAGFSPTNSPIWVIEDRKLLQKMGVEPENQIVELLARSRAGLGQDVEQQCLTPDALKPEVGEIMMCPVRHRVFEKDLIGHGEKRRGRHHGLSARYRRDCIAALKGPLRLCDIRTT